MTEKHDKSLPTKGILMKRGGGSKEFLGEVEKRNSGSGGESGGGVCGGADGDGEWEGVGWGKEISFKGKEEQKKTKKTVLGGTKSVK